MTTQSKAKDALDAAIIDFNHVSKMLTNSLNSTSPSERTLTNKLNTLKESVTKLNSAHTFWVTKSGLDTAGLAAEVYSNTWLEEQWNNADDLEEKYDALLNIDPPTPSVPQQLEMLESMMTTV